MKPRLLIPAAAVLFGVAAAIGTGWAFFTTSGTGTAAGAVRQMNAPTNVTATVPNPSVRTVHLTWVIPTTPDNSAPNGFTVARSNGTTTSAACGTGSTPLPGTSINCDDTNVPSGTYTYTVTMSWKSWTSTSTPSSSVTVDASALNHFTVVPSTSTPTAGAQFSVTVTAIDQYGSTMTTYTNNECVTFSGPSPAPGGTAPLYPAAGSCTAGNSSVTFSSGVGTPNVILYNAQSATLTVTDVATSKTGSASVAVSAASAAKFAVPTPTTQTAGTTFSLTITAHDTYDNVAAYSGPKTLTWSGPGTAPDGSSQPSYPPNPVTFSSGGQATVNVTLYKAESPTLTVGDGTISGLSGSFTVNPGPASRLAFTTQPGGGTSGTAWATQPVVKVQDTYWNVVTTDTSNVTVAIGTNPASGTLSGTKTVAASSGVATFAGLSIDKAGSGYTLVATDGSLTSATSSGFSIGAGPAAKLVFTTPPGGGTGGTAWATQPVVKVQDSNGNVVTTDTSNVTVAIGTNPASGTLSGTKTVAASSGVATFAGLSIDKAGSGYTLVATDGSLTSATSSPFNISAGAATKLVFTTQPSGASGSGANGGKNIAFPVQPVVTAEDALGNTDLNYTTSVALTISGGTLTCSPSTNAATPVNGVAMFSGCAGNTLGTFTLTATSGSLTNATSNSFGITGLATKLIFTTQPGGGVTNTAWSQQPAVSLEDGNNRVVTANSSTTVTLAMGTNPNGAVLTCTPNPVTASYGVATFSGCSTDKVGTGYTLSATSSGLTAATSSSFAVTGPATQLVFQQVPASGTLAGNAFATQPKVAVEDASGNVVVGYSTQITLAITAGTGQSGAVLSCTTNPLTPTSGVATFAGCAIDRWGTAYTLTATSGSLTAGVSSSFDVYAFTPSLSLNNKAGGVNGKPEQGDTIVITYPDPISASTFCGGQSGSFNLSSNVTVTFTNSGADKITGITDTTADCTGTSGFGAPTTGIGTVTLGTTNKYFKVASGSFTNGSASWNAVTNTMTITLGTLSGAGTNVGTGTSTTASYAPDASLSVPASANPIAGATKIQF